MAARDAYDALLVQNQALSEAISVLTLIEQTLQAAEAAPRDMADAKDRLDSLGTRLRSLQERFSPRLASLGIFAGQLNAILAAMEGGVAPGPKHLAAAKDAMADLESYFRQSSAELMQQDRWIRASPVAIRKEIDRLQTSLAALMTMLGRSNLPVRETVPDQEFRQTVISILSAAIEELKAPVVNPRRLGRLVEFLQGVGRKTAEREIGDAISNGVDEAVVQSGRLLEKLKDATGIDGFF